MANGTQFDPIAAAASAGINAADRGLSNLQNDLGAPQLPAQGQAVQSANQVINSVAQLSPANVLAQSNLPALPGQGNGQQGQFQLPGMQGQGIPTPQQLVQGQGPLPSLQSLLPFGQGQGIPTPPMPGNGSGGSGGGGGSSGGGSSASMSRTNPDDLAPSS